MNCCSHGNCNALGCEIKCSTQLCRPVPTELCSDWAKPQQLTMCSRAASTLSNAGAAKDEDALLPQLGCMQLFGDAL